MASPAYQAGLNLRDARIPVNQLAASMQPIPQSNALVPYQAPVEVLNPGEGPYQPNFVMQPNQYGPRVVPGTPEAPLPGTLGYNPNVPGNAEVQMNRLRKEDVLDYGFRQRVEAEQAAAEAAAQAATRQPARGGTAFELDPVTGKLVPIDTTLQRATPNIQIIEDAGKTLASAVAKMSGQMVPETTGTVYKTQTISPKTGAQPYTRITKREGETTFGREGQAFNMTAEEKIAWNKAKSDLVAAAPEFKGLTEKAIAAKMMDREWIADAIKNLKEKDRVFNEMAQKSAFNRAASDAANQAALKREQNLQTLMQLQDALGARPVKRGGQGPKTRAHQQNMLRPDDGEIQNALAQ
jgi:hypothetical protein